MNNFVTIQLFKTFGSVKYYTFQVEGRKQSETDNFFSTYENRPEVSKDLEKLVAWITEIGSNRGAKSRYFRSENAADALPPPASIMAELTVGHCDLRLYCVRLTDQVVILANGGIKMSQTVQGSPDLMPAFQFANKMARQLLELIRERSIDIDGKEIMNLEEVELWN